MKSKTVIKDKIEAFKATLEKYKDARAYSINNHQPQYAEFLKFTERVQKESRELTNLVNELTGSKLAVIDQMIDEGLLNAGQESAQNLLNKMNGVLNISQSIIERINQIEDVSLRELVYREMVNEANAGLGFDELVSKAQAEYDILVGKKTRQVIEECKAELKANGVAPETVENAMGSIKIEVPGQGKNGSEYSNEGLATVGDTMLKSVIADHLYRMSKRRLIAFHNDYKGIANILAPNHNCR